MNKPYSMPRRLKRRGYSLIHSRFHHFFQEMGLGKLEACYPMSPLFIELLPAFAQVVTVKRLIMSNAVYRHTIFLSAL